ncbi:MAG: RNA polymerase sigma-70 factor [Bacteroidetes bacterium]|nr:MAG: RNA polymerase sigma-70 factor [Bacteroidota bacterium]
MFGKIHILTDLGKTESSKVCLFCLAKSAYVVKPTPEEQSLLQRLRQGEQAALDSLFRLHYGYLCQVVYRVLPDTHRAEDLVQEVFLDLWRKRERLLIEQSVQAYLRRAAVNKTLNYIRDQKLHLADESYLPYDLHTAEAGAQQQLQAAELQAEIDQAVGRLPERCRIVFSLSRFEGMSNQEIADALHISIKTVENQMTKALRMLKTALAQHLSLLWGCVLALFLL